MNKRHILMLEYDEDDQYTTLQHFREHPSIVLDIVNTSDELIESLRRNEGSPEKLPSLLLLNYNSTPKNAPELLSDLKNNSAFAHIPVVVLSGIATPSMVRECYQMGASSFIRKPALMDETRQKINGFLNYWFETAELPI